MNTILQKAMAGEPVKLPPVDFTSVKKGFSLTRAATDAGITVIKRANSTFVACPFHDERTASCHIFDDNRFTCFGCGTKGSIIDFVIKIKPELMNSTILAAYYLIDAQGAGNPTSYQVKNAAQSKQPAPSVPAVRELKAYPKESFKTHPKEIEATYQQLLSWEKYAPAYEYAQQRHWLASPVGVLPYYIGGIWAGAGDSFLAAEPCLAFRKMILTRRTAEAFGLEEQFEAERMLCVGTKKRLLPATVAKWEKMICNQSGRDAEDVPKWLCKTGYINEIPFEFDENEDAPVLVICEGPGDGLRLFNEAHQSEEAHAKWGSRWHITATDSCSTWTVDSLPRRPVTCGKEKMLTSFFGGFAHIVVLFDPDEPGRKGAEKVVELASRQNSSAQIRNVCLPDNLDVGEFFDRGNTIADLAEIIRRCAPIERECE